MWLERGELAAIGDPRRVIADYRRRDIELAQEGERRLTQSESRWGDGTAEVVEAWVEDARGNRVDVVPQSEQVTCHVRVRFVEAMEEPIFGLSVKSESGVPVFVTNTMFDHVRTGSFDAGEEVRYSVSFETELVDGQYTISPAVAHHDGKRMADWREQLVWLRIQAGRHTGGIVDLAHRTELSEPSRDAAPAEKVGAVSARTGGRGSEVVRHPPFGAAEGPVAERADGDEDRHGDQQAD
jgi:hypothetical protein